MEVRNDKFAAFIDYFTTNTYVMVIMSDPTIRKPATIFSHLHTASAVTLLNIQNARRHFEQLESGVK
jgi:Ras-related GTP-binding protein A/B